MNDELLEALRQLEEKWEESNPKYVPPAPYDCYVLEQTCFACPEQYDLLLDGKCIGYLRLRHGYFYATYPDITDDNCEKVYSAYPEGDGCFMDHEREKYLTEAIAAIHNARMTSWEE